MKKINLLLISAMAAAGSLFAQNLEIGATGAYKSTWLFNQNISDKGDEQDYAAGWGYNYGLGATFYFTPKIGLGVEGLLNLHSGNYTGKFDSTTYNSDVKMNSIEIPLLFKLRSATGAYLEIGPQMGLISGARYDVSGSTTFSNGSSSDFDTSFNVTSNYASSNFSAVLGFGMNIKLVSHLMLKTGLRFEYGLADLKGVDAMGKDINDVTFYPTPRPTNSAAGSLFLSLVWRFGPDPNSGGSTPPPPPPPGN
jgi:hypothetical protein